MSNVHEFRQQPTRDLLLHELTIARDALHRSRAELAALRTAIGRLPVRAISVRADAPAGEFVALDDVRALVEGTAQYPPPTPIGHRPVHSVPREARQAGPTWPHEYSDDGAWWGIDG